MTRSTPVPSSQTVASATTGDAGLEAVLDATRQLMWVTNPAEAADVARKLITHLGGQSVPADAAYPVDVMPVDVSFGEDVPLVPSAPPLTLARLLLERHLPSFMLDAHWALALADKLSYALDDNIEGGRVVVTLRNGQQRMAHVGVELGHPSRPVPDARLISKFKDCCQHAARPLSPQRVDDLIALVANLEALDDVSELARLAAGDAVTG